MCVCVLMPKIVWWVYHFFPLKFPNFSFPFFLLYIYLQLDYDFGQLFCYYLPDNVSCVHSNLVCPGCRWIKNEHVFFVSSICTCLQWKWPMVERRTFCCCKALQCQKRGDWRWWITAHVLLVTNKKISHLLMMIYLFPERNLKRTKNKNKTERSKWNKIGNAIEPVSRRNGFCFHFLYCVDVCFDICLFRLHHRSIKQILNV